MRQSRRRLVCALVLVGLAAPVAGMWAATRNRLTVTNASGQEVRDLAVSVGGETFRFGALAPGDSASARFSIRHEETFEVRCRLADGTEVHEYEGYVVWEEDLFGTCARLVILAGGALQSSSALW